MRFPFNLKKLGFYFSSALILFKLVAYGVAESSLISDAKILTISIKHNPDMLICVNPRGVTFHEPAFSFLCRAGMANEVKI